MTTTMTDTEKLRQEYREEVGGTWNMTYEWYADWLEQQLIKACKQVENNGVLADVSNRRELLNDFVYFNDQRTYRTRHIRPGLVDEFLKSI